MRGASGALGDELVFKQRAGKTIISLPPVPTTKAPSPAQLAVQERFRAAIAYAKSAIADPDKKGLYTLLAPAGASGFNVAFSDFFKAPEITQVDMADGVIAVYAKDNVSVVSVTVTLLTATGEVLESGMAGSGATPESPWTYAIVNGSQTATTVRIEVSDLPGNVTVEELQLSS